MTKREELLSRIAQLHNEAQSTSGRAKAIVDRADREHRDITQLEKTDSDRLFRRFDAIEDEMRGLEDQVRELDEQIGATSAGRVVPAAMISNGARRVSRAPTGPKFANLFRDNAVDPYSGKFESFGDFAAAVAVGGRDQRLMISNASITEGSGASAGFLVPDVFVAQILDAALEQEVVRPNATVLPMSSHTLTTAAFDYQDGTSAKRAGLQLLWTAEGGTLSEQLAVARKVGFVAKKGTILCRVTSEMTEDAPSFDRQLTTAMINAVAIGLDTVFVSGTGAGQPLGILNSPCIITVAKESGQAANTIMLANLANMVSRLTPGSWDTSTWLIHPTVLPKLLQLTVVVQNVAGTENVGGGLAAAVVQAPDGTLRIFGRPVMVTEACSAFSSAGDVIFCDLDEYAIGMRRDATIQMSRDVYFTTDEIGFRLTLRLDGQPFASAPTKLRDGTNTVSPFVVLGAR